VSNSETYPYRVGVLLDLLNLRTSVEELALRVRELPWDSDHDLVKLTNTQVLHVLNLFEEGKLSATDVSSWADLIDGREDIGFAPPLAGELRQFVFEVSSPELLSNFDDSLRTWKQVLSGSSNASN
jgi:hypothetical protein